MCIVTIMKGKVIVGQTIFFFNWRDSIKSKIATCMFHKGFSNQWYPGYLRQSKRSDKERDPMPTTFKAVTF
jgi:superfamily II helicase